MTTALRILLIDDDAVFCRLVRVMLEPAGYQVEVAETGRAGVDSHHRQRSDLILVDILMPDMDGLETIRELRRLDPSVKIIVITGADEQGSRTYVRSAVMFGARRSLHKPFSRIELLTAVTAVLGPPEPQPDQPDAPADDDRERA